MFFKIKINFRFSKKSAKPGKKDVVGSFPLSSVIFCDQQFSVSEDLNGFRTINDQGGLSLDCLKLALKVVKRAIITLPLLGKTARRFEI